MIPKNSKKRLREHDELAEEYLKMLPISQQAHPNKRFMTEQLEEQMRHILLNSSGSKSLGSSSEQSLLGYQTSPAAHLAVSTTNLNQVFNNINNNECTAFNVWGGHNQS